MTHTESGFHAGPLGLRTGAPALEERAFGRLWQAFMTARVSIALALLFVHGAMYALTHVSAMAWVVALCTVYLGVTLVERLRRGPALRGPSFSAHWISTTVIDVLMFSALELLQIGSISYTPLYALPVLLSSVLGSLRLAIGTAASVTLLLLGNAWRLSLHNSADMAPQFLQAGLTGAAFFMLALLVNQLAIRLAREQQLTLRSEMAERLQRQVNELVIETLGDGVLVVDANGLVRVANPSARRLLGPGETAPSAPFDLGTHAGWSSLRELAAITFERDADQRGDLTIHHAPENARTLHARTRLTAAPANASENLCVMFLQDLRELEARLRTEKLAALGRMSTAVAHEIRNPLAAIAQANELLEEDLREPAHKRLSQMVRQNAQRLGKIVDEVLDIARVKDESGGNSFSRLNLDQSVRAMAADWSQQTGREQALQLDLNASDVVVSFDPDHLRRVLINLLDNAVRHTESSNGTIRIHTSVSPAKRGILKVWSAGAPLEKSVQQHLFEPFFSSQSRSSGLGLYICRELCERHQAVISYQRARRDGIHSDGGEGNEFSVAFRSERAAAGTPAALQAELY
jgi:two-component system sensor histidine kinase PilS (NtrC family)